MRFEVLYACFLANLLIILVKTQTTGVCPIAACLATDDPCIVDGDCKTGCKCCAIGGFKCCKVPITTTVCSCGSSDTPCFSSATCPIGTSCCLDTTVLARCCQPVSATTPTTTTTGVVQCRLSDSPCRVDADCVPATKKCRFDKINTLKCCL